ncbi:MAG TPA: hypothetical protein RMH99_21445 [Sandaracinaceae bacterium LLY-WYZ-13_1]|nr:hypothetical protein [Sandaracinaceae bacterium LLY-WYZ-13_1]
MTKLQGVLISLLASALIACDGSEPADAGPDAGEVPMEDDAGADAGETTPDAGTDAGEGPVDGGGPDAGPTPPPRDTLEVLTGQTATGYTDAIGSEARLNGAAGAARSPDGSTLYVADTFNSLIRSIDVATGEVTTIAGAVQEAAVVDDTGLDARFDSPRAMAITPDGSALYVADSGTIRRIALPSLEVTTVAGVWTMTDYVDAVGEDARFGFLVHDFAFSADGRTLYIADRSNLVLRALDTDTNEVTTLAGAPYSPSFPPQHADGTGSDVRMTLGGIVRVGDAVFIADTFNDCIRRYDIDTGEVTTVAGDPTMEGNMDGVGSAATFETPQQLSSDGTHLYVMGFNGVLRRVRLSDYTVETILGSAEDVRAVDGTGEDVRFGVSFGPSPLDPDAGTAGVLYFNDRDANSFRAVDLDALTVNTVAGAVEPRGSRDGDLAEARFDGPADVVCTAAGDVCYVSDEGNHTVRIIDRETGTVDTLAGAPGEPDAVDGALDEARFAAPAGLALNETEGLLYVADSANHTLRLIDLDAGMVGTVAGAAEIAGSDDGAGGDARFSAPVGLALTSDGATLYVGDQGNATIRTVDTASATVATLAGSAGERGDDDGVGAAARFRRIGGLELAADGATLYLTDRDFFAAVVRAIDTDTTEVTTLAGLAGERGVADGALADARFGGPWDLVLSPSGDLMVADLRNGLVRRIDLEAGMVDTWIGNVAIAGNPPAGMRWSLSDATLYFPGALARAGEDLVILAEDAVLVARPEGSW